jgi:hypothetical protein
MRFAGVVEARVRSDFRRELAERMGSLDQFVSEIAVLNVIARRRRVSRSTGGWRDVNHMVT